MLFLKDSIYSKNLFIPSVFESLEKAGVFSPVDSTGAVKKEAPFNHAEHKEHLNNLYAKAAPVEKEKEEQPKEEKEPVKEPEKKEESKEEEKKPEKSKKGKK